MNGIYVIIGGNLGNREHNLENCRKQIELKIGQIDQMSSIYQTAAWGNEADAPYLNQVLKLSTKMSPGEVLQLSLKIEENLGRVRNEKWESRLIDIDLLFFNDQVLNESELIIPHPHLQKRKFVLVPMNEIAPSLVHPVLHKTIHELLSECQDPLNVDLYQPNDER